MPNMPRRTSALALAAWAISAPTVGWGQSIPRAGQTASSDEVVSAVEQQTGVDEIIVTAQRVAQPLQRVPVSVQPLTGQELEERKINELVQLQSSVPSLGVGTDSSFSLRGVGSLTFTPSVDSSVGVAVDDVSLGVPIHMNFFGLQDIERVEVLLGPQGLLFGRNASAGLLNIVTKRPQFDSGISGDLYVEGDYRDGTPDGGFGAIVRGTLNVPVSPTSAFRLNGFYSDQDSVARVVARTADAKVGDHQRRFGVKGKFLFEPFEALSIYVLGDYGENRGIGANYDRTHRFSAPGSITAARIRADGIEASPGNLALGYSAPSGGFDLNTGGTSAAVTYEVADGIVVSNILAWRAYDVRRTFDNDFTTADGVDLNSRSARYHQLSNELRAAIETGSLIDGQIGLYYFGSTLRQSDFIGAAAYGVLDPLFAAQFGPSDSITNPYNGLDANSRTTNRSYAAFGQFNLHPSERLTLIAGARVTHDDNTISLVQNQRPYPLPLGARNVSIQEGVENTDFSWKLGGQYDIPIGMVYATYSKGYKGPAFNDTAAVVGRSLAIGPETVYALEAGAKTTFLDRRLRLNLSIFRQRFNDFQVQGYDSASQSFFTANAARVKSDGVEIFVEGRPSRSLSLTVAATILDSEFLNFPNDRCYPGQPTCSAANVTDSAGNPTPSSARFTSTIGANYERPISGDATVSVAGSWYHRSPISFTSNANPAQSLGTLDTFDLKLGVTLNDRINLDLFCKNCTDERYPIFIGLDAVDSSIARVNSTIQQWGYNSIRTIGVSASLDF